MYAPAHSKPSTLRQNLERAAGMHTAPVAGTKVQECGACAAGACVRCLPRVTVGARELVCPCTHGIDPADWDAAYGPPWGVDVDEGE
jgi:hypothetical protein